MLLVTRASLAHGWRAGCWTALGIGTGLLVHAALAVAGVSAVISEGGWLGKTMQLAAAAYLIWLGWQLLRSGFGKGERFSANIDELKQFKPSSRSHWWRGTLCNLLNPKVVVFLAGVTAPFLALKNMPSAWPVIIWATIVFQGFALWCLWAVLLQIPIIRSQYQRYAKWTDLVFGIALIALAAVFLTNF